MRAVVLNFIDKDIFSEERNFGRGKVIQKTDKEQNMMFPELKQHQGRDNNPEKISDTWNSKNIIWATNRILNSLVVAINKEKIGKINFNHIFYFTQYSQTITTPIHKQCKMLMNHFMWILLFIASQKCGMYFALTVHLHLNQTMG